MSQKSTSKKGRPPPTSPPPEEEEEKDVQQKKKNRRGAGSKRKAFDKHRSKTNDRIQNGLDKKSEEKIEQLRNGIKSLQVAPIFSRHLQKECKPPLEVPVRYWFLPELVEKVMRILPQARIIFEPEEFLRMKRALHCVSAAQLEAKLFFSRVGCQFRHADEWTGLRYEFCSRICESAIKNFRPIAAFLDQVGKFQIDGQEFYPSCPGDSERRVQIMPTFSDMAIRTAPGHPMYQYEFLRDNIVPHPDSVPLENRGPHGGQMYAQIIDPDAAGMCGFLSIENGNWNLHWDCFRPEVARTYELGFDGTPVRVTPPDITYELEQFGLLMAKVQNRVGSYSLVDLKLKEGEGTCAQLTARYPGTIHGEADVWSSRNITDSDLVIGGVFEFGMYPSGEHPVLYHPDVACRRAGVFSENATEELVSRCFRD